MAFSFRAGSGLILERELGAGGSGCVERRVDPATGARFAVKRLLDPTPDKVARFRFEYQTLGSIRHDAIVEAYGFYSGGEAEPPSFWMEYVDGTDFVSAIRSGGTGGLRRLIGEALSALEFLHERGIVHGDLKPDNLLVRREARHGVRVAVVDFGMAFQPKQTGSRSPAGTMPYLAPELFQGASPSIATDLYSLGAVVFETLAGHAPMDVSRGDLGIWLEELKKGVDRSAMIHGDEGLRDWVEKVLQPEPSFRPLDASEARSLLLVGEPSLGADMERLLRRARLRSGRSPGRETEFDEFWSILRDEDAPGLVFVCADGGMGKSEFLRVVSNEAIVENWQTVRGTDQAALRQAMDADPEGIPDRLLVVADHAESGGHDLEAILDHVVARRVKSRVVVAVRPFEIRSERITNYFRSAGAHPAIGKIQLQPFQPEQTATFLDRAGVAPVEARRSAKEWTEATGGSPARLLDAWTAHHGGLVPRPEEIASLRDSRSVARLQDKIAGLPASARAALFSETLMPPGSSVELRSQLAQLSRAEFLESIVPLENCGLMVRRGLETQPASPDLPQAVFELLRATGAEWFRRGVSLLANERDADPLHLGKMELLAGDVDSGSKRLLQIASEAVRDGNLARTVLVLTEGLRNLPRRHALRGTFWMQRGHALFARERHDEAQRSYAFASRYLTDREELNYIRFRRAWSLAVLGRVDLSERLVPESGQGSETDIAKSRFELVRMLLLHRRGRNQQVIAASEVYLDQDLPLELEIEALQLRGICASMLRIDSVARSAFDRGIQKSQGATSDRYRVLPRLGLAYHLAREDDTTGAIASLTAAAMILEGTDADRLKLIVVQQRCGNLIRERRIDTALRDADELEFTAARVGDVGSVMAAQAWKMEAYLFLGKFGGAERAAAIFLDRSKAVVDHRQLAYTWLTRGEARLRMGPEMYAGVQECLDRSRRLCTEDDRLQTGIVLVELELAVAKSDWDRATDRAQAMHRILDAHDQSIDDELEIRLRIAEMTASLAQQGWPAQAPGDTVVNDALDAGLPDLAAIACAVLVDAATKAGARNAAEQAHHRGNAALVRAASLLESEDHRQGFFSRPEFRALRKPLSPSGQENERLTAIYRMIRGLNSETDPDALLESMLDMALDVVNAERGLVLLRGSDGELRARVARNLEQATIQDAVEFSRNVVSEAVAGRPVLAMDTGQDERLKDFKSVSVFGIRSLICVPLRSGAKIIGAVYLDNRKEGALFDTDDLRFLEAFADHAALALRNAQRERKLTRENQRLRALTESRDRFEGLIGRSDVMQAVYDLIERFAETSLPVLIQGESGTGKELVAKAICRRGSRRKKPFLSENCASIPETLLEAELFGHVKGAFTGADRDRAGLFVEAHSGTLFLDEIGDMPASMQARLLRVLQDGDLRPVGGNQSRTVDVRILAATHRDLASRVKTGEFREDLLFRLQVLQVNMPRLRDRQGDVPLLVNYFLAKIGEAKGGEPIKIFNNVMDLLERYPWPGNVRELENVLQRLSVLSGGKPIRMELIESHDSLRRLFVDRPAATPSTKTLAATERDQIADALEATGGNKAQAAKLLGVSRATFFRRLKQIRLP